MATAWLRLFVYISFFRFEFHHPAMSFYLLGFEEQSIILIKPSGNQCCNQNQCADGGTCTELCEDAKNKFNCSCAIGYYGRYCQKRKVASCKEQLQRNEEASLESTNFLTKQLRPCTRSTAILTLVMDLLGHSSSHSAWQIREILQTRISGRLPHKPKRFCVG